MRSRLEDLPPAIRKQVEAKEAKERAGKPAQAAFAPLQTKGQLKAATKPTKAKKGLDRMNGTERRFYDMLKDQDWEVLMFEDLTLKLGENCRYTPDFLTADQDGVFLWEVKGGFIREDGWQKLKIAAKLFPCFNFRLAQYDPKKSKVNPWTITAI